MTKNRFSVQRPFDSKFSTTLTFSFLYPLGPAALILAPIVVGGLIEDYGFSEHQAATVASAEGAGIVVASVAASLWVRKVSWISAIGILLTAYAAINFLSTKIDDFSALAMVRFIAGLIGGSIFAISVAGLGDNNQPDRAFGLAQGAQGVAMFAAFSAAPILIQNGGVAAIFALLAVSALILLFALHRLPSAGEQHTHSQPSSGRGQSLALIFLGLTASLVFFVNIFGFWSFAERIGDNAKLSRNVVSLALGLSQIAAIAGAVATTIVGEKLGRFTPLLVVLIVQSLAMAVLLLPFNGLIYVVSLCLFQAFFIIGVSYQMGVIAKLDIAGRFLVLMTAAQGIGAALGPSVGAQMIVDHDYSRLIYMAVACCVISSICFLFIVRQYHEGRSDDDQTV